MDRPLPKYTISLPYDVAPFNKIKCLLERIGVRVVGKASSSLGQLLFTKLKDKIPKDWMSGVVYQVTCECGGCYVGHTNQYLKDRLRQHNSRVPDRSALAAHLSEGGCVVNLDNVKVLCSEDNLHRRRTKEMIFIKRFGNINYQTDCETFPDSYHNIV